jgi:hypothetical protein
MGLVHAIKYVLFGYHINKLKFPKAWVGFCKSLIYSSIYFTRGLFLTYSRKWDSPRNYLIFVCMWTVTNEAMQIFNPTLHLKAVASRLCILIPDMTRYSVANWWWLWQLAGNTKNSVLNKVALLCKSLLPEWLEILRIQVIVLGSSQIHEICLVLHVAHGCTSSSVSHRSLQLHKTSQATQSF